MDFINIILGFLFIICGILLLIYYQNYVEKRGSFTPKIVGVGIAFIIGGIIMIIKEF
ncbi:MULTISPECIES: hypothetical protein [Aquimarina]|uniref:hypothetical protein n=1 Tax=Aquimarina TaxID=290174 RepID=UPI0004BC3C11|nr:MULTISPECIES: hypothetical protein [Aquimarina]